VTAIPAASLAAHTDEGASLEELVRAFARRLLTDRPSLLTAGEWIERKRTAVLLQALIGDKPEAWTSGELSLMRDIAAQRRTWPKELQA